MPIFFAGRYLGIRSGLLFLGASIAAAQTAPSQYTQANVEQLLKANCGNCHGGRVAAGGFDVSKLTLPDSLRDRPERWAKAASRVQNGEMPPQAPLSIPEREAFAGWVNANLHAQACAAGVVPGPAPVRLLILSQSSSTIGDLLNFPVASGATLPADGAGGEGFDNAA